MFILNVRWRVKDRTLTKNMIKSIHIKDKAILTPKPSFSDKVRRNPNSKRKERNERYDL